jgi:hypothetical protein
MQITYDVLSNNGTFPPHQEQYAYNNFYLLPFNLIFLSDLILIVSSKKYLLETVPLF